MSCCQPKHFFCSCSKTTVELAHNYSLLFPLLVLWVILWKFGGSGVLQNFDWAIRILGFYFWVVPNETCLLCGYHNISIISIYNRIEFSLAARFFCIFLITSRMYMQVSFPHWCLIRKPWSQRLLKQKQWWSFNLRRFFVWALLWGIAVWRKSSSSRTCKWVSTSLFHCWRRIGKM